MTAVVSRTWLITCGASVIGSNPAQAMQEPVSGAELPSVSRRAPPEVARMTAVLGVVPSVTLAERLAP